MMTQFKGIFTRPTFDNDEVNQQARLLHALLVATFIVNILYLVWIFSTNLSSVDYYFSNLVILIFQVMLLMLLKCGYVKTVSSIFVALMWLAITNSTYLWGGVLDPLYPSYLLVILIAGWVLHPFYAVLLVAMSSGMGYLYLLENGFTDDASWAWEASTTIFIIGAIIGYLSQKILKESLQRIKIQQKALERTNEELSREIKERRQIEAELRRTELQYRQMVEMSPVAMLIGDRDEYVVKYANARAVQLFGVESEQELLGQSIRERLVPEAQANMENRLKALKDTGTLPAVSSHITRPNGEVRDIEVGSINVEFEGEPAALSVIHDITHRKQMENILKENESRYRNLLETIPVAVVVIDIKTKKIAYVNPKAIELLGAKTASDLIEMPFTMFILDDYKDLSDVRFEMLESDGNLPPIEYTYRRLDGRKINVEITSILTTYQGLDVSLSVFSDVTERNHMQEQLREADMLHVTLSEKNKVLAMKDTFMTTISHEFRTPLTIINSSKELLEKYYDRMDEDRRQGHFTKMGNEIEYMAKLLDDILFLSEASSGILKYEPQSIDLYLLCSDVFNEYKRKYADTHQIGFSAENPDETAIINLHEDLIRQTLKHLLDNAVKYSPDGGQIQLHLTTDVDGATIKVSDEGIGMSEAIQQVLFEPFKRGDHNLDVSSVGLGLAIIKQVVDVHHGSIFCDSVLNQGTIFTVRLPAKP